MTERRDSAKYTYMKSVHLRYLEGVAANGRQITKPFVYAEVDGMAVFSEDS